MPNVEWTDGLIEVLRSKWLGGGSTSQIGREMGISKNAVIAKAHRLNLPRRPHAIKPRPEGAPVPTRRKRVGKTTIAPLASIASAPKAAPGDAPPANVAVPVVESLKAFPTRPVAEPQGRVCCWPEGDPGSPGFRYCSAPAEKLKPYCAEHNRRAWITVLRRA